MEPLEASSSSRSSVESIGTSCSLDCICSHSTRSYLHCPSRRRMLHRTHWENSKRELSNRKESTGTNVREEGTGEGGGARKGGRRVQRRGARTGESLKGGSGGEKGGTEGREPVSPCQIHGRRGLCSCACSSAESSAGPNAPHAPMNHTPQ